MVKRTLYGKRIYLMHRYLWMKTNGQIPTGMCVCHSCDNRECINIDHLFLGTHLENIFDCVSKGRNKKGSKHNWAKLNDKTVKEIFHSTAPNRKIANDFKISIGHVRQIKAKVRWNHLRIGVICAKTL